MCWEPQRYALKSLAGYAVDVFLEASVFEVIGPALSKQESTSTAF